MSEGVPRSGGVPLGLFRTPSCEKERAMNRAWLEEQIRVQFGSQRAALVAALHEVQVCVEFPECWPPSCRCTPIKRPMERSCNPPPLEESSGCLSPMAPPQRFAESLFHHLERIR